MFYKLPPVLGQTDQVEASKEELTAEIQTVFKIGSGNSIHSLVWEDHEAMEG